MFDTCFDYDDHLRGNGHWAGGEERGDGGCRVRKLVGLSPAGSARSLRRHPDGKVPVTDGPYTETK
jgi:hypothetical protein